MRTLVTRTPVDGKAREQLGCGPYIDGRLRKNGEGTQHSISILASVFIPDGSWHRSNQGIVTTAEHLPNMKYLRTVRK